MEQLTDYYVESIAKQFSSFFNAKSDWYNSMYKVSEQPQDTIVHLDEPIFDEAIFKEHILSILKEQQRAFASIKDNHQEEWNKILKTGVFTGEILQQLEHHATQLSPQTDQLEKMSYLDMLELSKAIHELRYSMGGMSHLGQSIQLGAKLGLAKTKAGFIVEYSNMSSSLKERFAQAVDKNIENRFISVLKEMSQTRLPSYAEKMGRNKYYEQQLNLIYETMEQIYTPTDTKNWTGKYIEQLNWLVEKMKATRREAISSIGYTADIIHNGNIEHNIGFVRMIENWSRFAKAWQLPPEYQLPLPSEGAIDQYL